MRLGYFTMPLHPPSRNYTEVLKEDREAIVLADRLGYAEAFVGEHVTDLAEPVTSCLTFIASLIDRTEKIVLGSGTVNLPNNHPAQVAAQVAMIDHLLEGRFLFGISPGGLLSDAEAFGNLDRDRTAMFVEAIDQVLAIWAGEAPYELHGDYWVISTRRTMNRETGQGSIVKPYQRPHPPIVVTAVAPFSKGVVVGGRARLDADLGELPAAELGRVALAEVRRGLHERRAHRRYRGLARGEERVRRRRRGDGAALRQRARRPVCVLLPLADDQAHRKRPPRAVQGGSRDARRRDHARLRARLARDLRNGRLGRRAAARVSRDASATSARCSTPVTTGSIRRSRSARWS